MYFGPAKEARSYFESLGFAPRPRQTTPDYVTGCTDEFEREYAPGRSAENAPHDPESLMEAFRALERNVAALEAMNTRTINKAKPPVAPPTTTMTMIAKLYSDTATLAATTHLSFRTSFISLSFSS